MVTTALFVRLEAKAEKVSAVEAFLRGGLPLAQAEPKTTAWFALRMGPSTFGIFDAFPDDAGRDAHLSGKVAKALMAYHGPILATNLAAIYAQVGERDLALEQLARLIEVPNGPTPGTLRIEPEWDALRGDSRFDKIVASLAPK